MPQPEELAPGRLGADLSTNIGWLPKDVPTGQGEEAPGVPQRDSVPGRGLGPADTCANPRPREGTASLLAIA